ncbi:MAG: ankyrin repeat domain-containing protein [Blastocatellia bacterium]
MKKLLLLSFTFGFFIFGFQQKSETQTESQTAVDSIFIGPAGVPSLAIGSHQPGQSVAEADLRTASAKAIKLMQHSQVVWSSKETCTSCHHQLLPQIPIKLARERGIPLDEKIARETTAASFAHLKDLDAAVQYYDYIDVLFDGWSLFAAHLAGVNPSLTTAAYAQFIASHQLPDGSWFTIDVRPPQAASVFTTTAVCAHVVKTYLPGSLKKEREMRLRRAREWLTRSQPRTTEDRTFQLYGMRWTGADEKIRNRAVRQLLAEQRQDGGWSQLAGLTSDAYATGQVLVALNQAGNLATTDPAYQRGLQFLLKTQQADGSWRVSSRLHPPAPVSPPYFETGFPYQHDQFVSAMGTSWAAAALLHAIPTKAGERLERAAAPDVTPSERAEWIQTSLTGTAADLRRLLDGGMKPDVKTAGGTTALMLAARDLDKVKLLVDRGADVNARAATGITPLMVAARYRGNAEVVRLLLKKGAKPNVDKGVEVRYDASALFFAVMAGDVQTAGALLDAGARLNNPMKLLGRFALSPLTYAAFGDAALVEYLIGRGGNPNEVDDNGISILASATFANNWGTVQALLARGANVNQVDKLGMTPLHYAASIDFGDTSVMEKLIAAGADVNARNKEGLTALDLAKRYGHASMANLLSAKTAAR